MVDGGYLNTLTLVVAIVASLGQKDFAATKAGFVHQIEFGSFDLSPWLAPVVFDVSVAALLHGGLRWAAKRHSPWPWWFAAACIAGLSVFTNFLHVGWQITAPASGGLFVIWFLRLYFQYRELQRDREVQDSGSDEFRSTDMLFDVDKRLASTAWLIARTKPLAAGLAYRHAQGDTMLTKRDLAIMLARHSNTIYDDQLYRLINRHLFSAPTAAAPAGSEKDTKTKTARRLHWWNRKALADARRRAAMTAEDEVDRFLGLMVIERTGIVIAEVTYQKQPEPTELFAKQPARRTLPQTPREENPLPALPQPRPARRRAGSVPSQQNDAPVVDATEIAEIVAADGTITAFEKPDGNAGINWKPLSEIKGLEGFAVDPEIDCRCNPNKPCGWKLVDHVMRRGKHVEAVIEQIPDWVGRSEQIGKPDAAAAGVSGSGGQMTVAAILNHLRLIPLYGNNA